MKFPKLNSDKEINVTINGYKVVWGHKVSGPQLMFKNYIKPYWATHCVLEEFRIPGSLLRIDLLNINRRIAVEISPESTHGRFNKFMHGSRAGYRAVIMRDEEKRKYIENQLKYTFVEIFDADFEEFKKGKIKEWFLDKYQIIL